MTLYPIFFKSVNNLSKSIGSKIWRIEYKIHTFVVENIKIN